MQFLYQPLTWGFLLVLAPLIIHLINLMRQQRVEWGAMEFLLKAHRKHRKWIWLRQMLLLATRMLLIAAVVAMLAHLITGRQWTALFGDQTTHHYVLLDDSYSMSDRAGSASAFDRAARAIGEFTNRLIASDAPQKMTLVRWSQAERAAYLETSHAAARLDEAGDETSLSPFDLNALDMTSEADEELAEARRKLQVSSSAAGPLAAIEFVQQLLRQHDGETAVLHLISDFRQETWQPALEALKPLADAASELQLIDCVDEMGQNLAITRLHPLDGTLAAGVPVLLKVEVRNYGSETARQVPIHIVPTEATADIDQPAEVIPAVLIEEIPPGESVTREVQVFFATAGQHLVTASLLDDAVSADNTRFCVVELPDTVPVLVIDGDLQQRNATYFQTVFRPSDRVATGVTPDIRDLSFLTTATAESLAKYRAIYLLDVMRLDQIERSNLERYVRDGGGLGVFLGPNVDWQAYDAWYQEGAGLFPVKLTPPRFLSASDEGAGMVASQHPTLKVLAGDDNPFASTIRFNRYFGIPAGETGPDVDVIARLGNGQPIVVERRFGQGRVMLVLSTLAPEWNNWATQPSFVVFLLELQAYLDSLQAPDVSAVVGTEIQFLFDPRVHSREVLLRSPAVSSSDPLTIEIEEASAAAPMDAPREVLIAGPGLSGQRCSGTPGVYEVSVRGIDGKPLRQRHVLNVDPREGNLKLYDRSQIAEHLGRDVQIVQASDVAMDEGAHDRFSWSRLLLFILPLMLVLEQWLAYSASYHPKRREAGA